MTVSGTSLVEMTWNCAAQLYLKLTIQGALVSMKSEWHLLYYIECCPFCMATKTIEGLQYSDGGVEQVPLTSGSSQPTVFFLWCA